MKVEIIPSTEKNELLEERIREKTGEYPDNRSSLIYDVEEDKIPKLVDKMGFIPGIKEVLVFVESKNDVKAISEKIGEMFEGKKCFDVSRKDVQDLLEESDKHDPDAEKVDLNLQEGEKGKIKIFSRKFEGVGGEPIDYDDTVVLRLEDRIDALAGVLLSIKGKNVVPVYIGKNPSSVKEGVETIKEYNPRSKLVVFRDEKVDEALRKTSNLYDTKKIAKGSIEKLDNDIVDPVDNKTEEEALKSYWDYKRHKVG